MKTRVLVLALLATAVGACRSPHVRVHGVLAPKPEVRVLVESAELRVTGRRGAEPLRFPGEYEELGEIVATTLAREWPNERVRFERAAAGAAAVAVRVAVVVAGSYAANRGELLVWVTIAVKEAGGDDVVGRPWSVGNVRLERLDELEAGLAAALPELRRQVADKTTTWVRDVKQAGARP